MKKLTIAAALAAAALGPESACSMRSSPALRAPSFRTGPHVPGPAPVVARAEFVPGGQADGTTHPGEELGYVVEGMLQLLVDASRQRRKAGDSVLRSRPAWSTTDKTFGRARRARVATYVVEKGKPARQRSSDPRSSGAALRHAHADWFVPARARGARRRLEARHAMAALAPDPVAVSARWSTRAAGARPPLRRRLPEAYPPGGRAAARLAEVRAGARTLDVRAAGYAAAAAAARGARVAGWIFPPRWWKLARSQNPEIEFREGEAEALPFPEAASTRW